MNSSQLNRSGGRKPQPSSNGWHPSATDTSPNHHSFGPNVFSVISVHLYVNTHVSSTCLRRSQDVPLSVHCARLLCLECQKCCTRTNAYWASRRAASCRRQSVSQRLSALNAAFFFISRSARGACFRTYLKRNRMSALPQFCHLMKQ